MITRVRKSRSHLRNGVEFRDRQSDLHSKDQLTIRGEVTEFHLPQVIHAVFTKSYIASEKCKIQSFILSIVKVLLGVDLECWKCEDPQS
jgi:hypothetical protein